MYLCKNVVVRRYIMALQKRVLEVNILSIFPYHWTKHWVVLSSATS